MYCKKCNSPVPSNALMCNYCKQKTGLRLTQSSNISADMFGNRVFELKEDARKSKVRRSYLSNLPEFVASRQRDKDSFNTILKTIGFFFLFIISFIAIFVLSIALRAFILIPFLFITLFVILIIKMKNTIKNVKSMSSANKPIYAHNEKTRYYANNDVIGYIELDHTSHDDDGTDYYYTSYEILKSNIYGISYDERYAEFVLHLKVPVYTNYASQPSNEFRIADIFDDRILSSALCCDLPPRNTPF